MYGKLDGAYWVCPNELSSESIVYSVGVGADVSFDIEIVEEHNCTAHAFDPTPEAIECVENTNLPEKFVFHPVGVSSYNGTAIFYPPKKSGMVSHRMTPDSDTLQEGIMVQVKTLKSLLDDCQHEKVDILKIDIEGAEYDIVNDICSLANEISQICIEFHHFFPKITAARTIRALVKLKDSGFKVFGRHGYNFSLIQVKSVT